MLGFNAENPHRGSVMSMFAVFQKTRKYAIRAIAALSFAALAACEPIQLTGPVGGGGGPTINTAAPVPVALLVPGGGSAGDGIVARDLENAARLAMADLRGVEIDLRVYNTGGNAQQAAALAQRAVDDGAKVILGPLFAEAANAAGVAVADDGVNVLSFSNNTSIAGGNVFVLGSTFDNTANRLVNYAKRQGKQRILVVHARNLAGQVGRDAIRKALARHGVAQAGITEYEFSQEGVLSAVPRIEGAISAQGADAIFLTSDTAGALPLFAQMLPEAGVTPADTQFIGLTRWDIPQQTLALSGVQGGWFALPDPTMSARFRSRYEAAYGAAPHPLAGLAFDGIAAIGALVGQGNRDALQGSALTQASGFVGTNGVFRLRADGTNQRALAVATVRNNQVVILDPAPTSFRGAGL